MGAMSHHPACRWLQVLANNISWQRLGPGRNVDKRESGLLGTTWRRKTTTILASILLTCIPCNLVITLLKNNNKILNLAGKQRSLYIITLVFRFAYCVMFFPEKLTFTVIPVPSLWTPLFEVCQIWEGIKVEVTSAPSFGGQHHWILVLQLFQHRKVHVHAFMYYSFLNFYLRASTWRLIMYFIDLFYRFESFNPFIRSQNVYSNRHAPSRDIVYNFSVLELIRTVCSVLVLTVLLQKGMCLDLWLMSTNFKLIYLNLYFRCGQGMSDLYHSTQVQRFLNCIPAKELLSEKAISAWLLRKVSTLQLNTTVIRLLSFTAMQLTFWNCSLEARLLLTWWT